MPKLKNDREPSRVTASMRRFLRRLAVLRAIQREQRRGNLYCSKCRQQNRSVKPRRALNDAVLCDACRGGILKGW